mgnify:CR=1 FL=1
MLHKNMRAGQALIEYLLIFLLMSFITIQMVRSVNAFMSTTVGSLTIALTDALSTGVCEQNCFFGGYANDQ